MTLYISNGTTTINVTQYLTEGDGLSVLTTELERDAFERKVSDLDVSLSNLDGQVYEVLRSIKGGSKWRAQVVDDNRQTKFDGIIEPKSVIFAQMEEVCSFNAFSLDRYFWDFVNGAKVSASNLPNLEHALGEVLYHVLNNSGLFSENLIRPVVNCQSFATRMIRCTGSDPAMGNEGRLSDIDPDMSLGDWLKQVALYYNAYWYIAPHTRDIWLNPRNTAVSLAVTNIDQNLLEDPEPELNMVDKTYYDYVKTPIYPSQAEPTLGLVGLDHFGLFPGRTYHYLVTQLLTSIPDKQVLGIQRQIAISEPPPNPNIGVNIDVTGILPEAAYVFLYRMVPANGQQEWQLMYIHTGNQPFSFVDDRAQLVPIILINHDILINIIGSAWSRFDETTNTWDEPIYDYGYTPVTPPQGNVFEAIPRLQFKGTDGYVRPYSPYEVFSLFRRDMTIELLREQWREFFISRRTVKCSVHTIIPAVNEKIFSQIVKGEIMREEGRGIELMVKKSECDVYKEETNMTLIAL